MVTAFLYRFLDEVIYIEQPHLFVTELDNVCKLIRTLYRLKLAPSAWYKALVQFLKKLRFVLDHRIFISKDKQLFIVVYVDDLLLFDADVFHLKDIQQKLHDWFKMTNLGDISHYLERKFDYVVAKKFSFAKVFISAKCLIGLKWLYVNQL